MRDKPPLSSRRIAPAIRRNDFRRQDRQKARQNRTSKVPPAWKNRQPNTTSQEGDVKELINYRSIGLLWVLYKLFIKTKVTHAAGSQDLQQSGEQEGFGIFCAQQEISFMRLPR